MLAERHGKVPDGKWLATVPLDDDLELRLVDAPLEETEAARTLIPVPAKAARYHSAARAFRTSTARHEISRDSVVRAARIVHAIAAEAERCGWEASLPGPSNEWLRTRHVDRSYKRSPGDSCREGQFPIAGERCQGRSKSGPVAPVER